MNAIIYLAQVVLTETPSEYCLFLDQERAGQLPAGVQDRRLRSFARDPAGKFIKIGLPGKMILCKRKGLQELLFS